MALDQHSQAEKTLQTESTLPDTAVHEFLAIL